MEIKGRIILAFPEFTGTSKAGNPWKKREYVLETQETYPRKVHFDFFGDKADQFPLSVGDDITLSFDIESREYQGRWYTSIRGWKAEKNVPGGAQPMGGGALVPPAPTYAAPTYPTAPPAPATPMEPAPNDDLPF